MRQKRSQKRRKVYRKTGKKRGKRTGKKRSHQRGGFFNRYDFAYAGRDVLNQAGKIEPGIIKQATGVIDKIAQNRINQVIKSGGAEVERVLPKIIRGAIEDVYKTPFRLLGNFGKQQFNKIKREILRYYTIFVLIIFYNEKLNNNHKNIFWLTPCPLIS